MAEGDAEDVASLREEAALLAADLKTALDAGVPVAEFPFHHGLVAAAEAALAIVESVGA